MDVGKTVSDIRIQTSLTSGCNYKITKQQFLQKKKKITDGS